MKNQQLVINIPAAVGGQDGVAALHVPHETCVFHCVSTTTAFDVLTPDGSRLTMTAGKGLGYPGGPKWATLKLYNTTGNAIAATVWVGNQSFGDNSATVTTTGITSVEAALDYTKSTDLPALGAAAVQTFNGLDNGHVRKSITVCNNDQNTDLQILDGANARGGLVKPLTSWVCQTAGTIKVKNPSGAAVDCCVLETFYSA